jgi:hypothetical protein
MIYLFFGLKPKRHRITVHQINTSSYVFLHSVGILFTNSIFMENFLGYMINSLYIKVFKTEPDENPSIGSHAVFRT